LSHEWGWEVVIIIVLKTNLEVNLGQVSSRISGESIRVDPG
jgi:hypothetical protein